jgi:hypothetical protein
LHGRQQEPDERGNDGDHDQELHEGEPCFERSPAHGDAGVSASGPTMSE